MSKTYRYKKITTWKVTDKPLCFKDKKSWCDYCEENIHAKHPIPRRMLYKERKEWRKQNRRKIRSKVNNHISHENYELIPNKEKGTSGWLSW